MRYLYTLSLVALLCGCDAPGEPGECSYTPDPLQHAPCDPLNGLDCDGGHCAFQAAPVVTWGCEMEEPGGPAGEPCERHEQCTTGICMPVEYSPRDLWPSLYGMPGLCALRCTGEPDCPGNSWCQPIAGSDVMVCVED